MDIFKIKRSLLLLSTSVFVVGCSGGSPEGALDEKSSVSSQVLAAEVDAVTPALKPEKSIIRPRNWPAVKTAPLDPKVEARIDDIISKMTLEQKVGQVLQADSNAVTPEEVKTYRLGSVLSGGNSAPGDLPYANAPAWIKAADEYYAASVDPEGVEVAIPMVWGIDAVHGHANLTGAVVFPHNIGLGAANDPDLLKRIAEVTATELSVSGHDWTFAPTLAVPQNDRWGRAYEGFSESPEIVKSYGGAIVRGLQGEKGTDGFMADGKVISSAKHFLGDGGTENGVDQGDARITEAELRDIHLAGYLTAVADGAQSVMASFSSWDGQPMHGQKELLTDVLKGRMNFQGFVVGDWNGHALIPGCTATDCPQALNAGLDMYMAPDSWKGLYESLLIHVKSGRVPMVRLDDAVRRILRVKINSGVFEKPKPSARKYSGQTALLGSQAHRDVAREAVRKSMVLLKNDNQLLPLKAGSNIRVVGKGADSIAKMAGGWTLSWQGGKHTNDEFPNSQTILAAIQEAAAAAGGRVSFDPDGTSAPGDADVVIAVYGEDPYAEFQGDRENVDFTPNDFDPQNLKAFKEAGVPVVSVFLSGRPLWTNPEFNLSDAFVAAFLPGSEGGGVSDLLFQTEPSYDFTGRLSFSWPKLATQSKLNAYHANYDPLFKLGYGLSYKDDKTLGELSEESGIISGPGGAKGIFFEKGASPQPWRLAVNGTNIETIPYIDGKIDLAGYDHTAQEDGLRVDFKEGDNIFSISSRYGHDYQRETNGAMELSFMSKVINGSSSAQLALGCPETGACETFRSVTLTPEWRETRISLKCFDRAGAQMGQLKQAFALQAPAGTSIALSNIRLKEESAAGIRCEN